MEGENSDEKYFNSYDDVEIHRLMLEDRPRTEAYRDAILKNADMFKGKVVMDVGAGTGILSLFCMKAGAKKVYAVEASAIFRPLEKLVKLNDPDGVIEVVHGKAEDVELGEKVDVIVSEWMGFYLLHESMLNSVIKARDKHLKEDSGLMFPSIAKLYAAPCSLESHINRQYRFWDSVYGFNMRPLISDSKPDVTIISKDQLLSPERLVLELDLRWADEEEIRAFTKRDFVSVTRSGLFQGLALWFDCEFPEESVTLRTGPGHPPTHWKQTVIVFDPKNEREEERVEVDDVIGWELNLAQCSTNPRQYAISVQVLDPAEDEHPVPCACQTAKCTLIKALLDKEELLN